jgi:hypothetical protein
MRYLTPLWGLQKCISFTGTMNGNPAIAVSADEHLYFANIAKGSTISTIDCPPSLTTIGTYFNIVIGKVNQYGTLLWMKLFPQLITPADEFTPSIVIGPNNTVFVGFVTLGGANGNINNGNIPSFCNPCAVPEFYDIVIARIDESVPGNPTVAWVNQSSMCNSCGKEMVPKLALDPVNQLLYAVGESTNQVQCIAPVGSRNIFINCLGFNGNLLWSEGSNTMNSTGVNSNPVVAADHAGGVYIAWETNGTVLGGATINNQQIEVVKFQTTVLSPGVVSGYSRSWVLSSVSNIRSTGIGELPTITADAHGNIFVAYVTNGVAPNGTKVNGGRDLAVFGLNTDGAIRWIKMGPSLNKAPYVYLDCSDPYLIIDVYGNIYVSLVAITSGGQILPVFKFNPTTGANNWKYGAYEAYLLAGSSSPYSQFPAAANAFSSVAIARYGGNFFMAVNTTQNLAGNSHVSPASSLDFCICSFYERTFAIGKTAFEYVSTKTLCNCGGRCSCST